MKKEGKRCQTPFIKTMTIEISIRNATINDIPALVHIIDPFVQQRKLLRRTEDELQLLIEHGFVAETAESIIGFAALEIYSPKLAELRSLAVLPEFQRTGIGKRLTLACVERAQQLQILELMAISSSETFFQSCGFNYTLPDERKAFFIQTRND